MKAIVYAKRNLKELLNDPLSLIFTIGLPAFLLVFIISLNKSLGLNEAFSPENFVPSIIIFSYSFLTMFSAILVSKDRSSSFLTRMFVTPLKPKDYIIGYMIPQFIIALIQSIILYGLGLIVGLKFSWIILLTIPFLLIISLLFIGMGMLFGSLLKEQQVGPIVSIVVQVVAFLSGMWFSLDLVGGAFEVIGRILPFSHAVDLLKYILANDFTNMLISLLILIGYILVINILAIITFKKKMKS